MEEKSIMAGVDRLMDDDDVAVIDDDSKEQAADTTTTTTGATNTGINNKSGGFGSGSGFLTKTRSLSDGGAKETPKLSPAPHIFSDPRRQSQDDIAIRDNKERVADGNAFSAQPSTPVRAGFPIRGLTLQLPQLGEGDALHLSHLQQHPQVHVNHLNLNATSPSAAHSQSHSHSHSQLQSQQQQPSSTPAGAPASTSTSSAHVKPAAPAPLSPKLDHSHIYASPSPNILPRRSRGLDFSRAATTLHHSTVVDQASPSSSPTIGSRAMNIPAGPGRWPGEHGTTMEQTSNSLWSVMGNRAHERMHVSSSLGSNAHTSHALFTDTSSSSDDDDIMDEDMEESIVTTPSANKMAMGGQHPWMPGGSSPAVNSLLSFQQRQRRKQPKSRKHKTPLGLGFHPTTPMGATTSMSPPQGLDGPQPRRESISWAANQLHISGSESDDPSRQLEAVDSPSRPGVIRRTVTRHRGNLLPKTKGFARIRAALLEESAPIEAEVKREAEVVRQVRESDMDLEPRLPTSALTSPNLTAAQDSMDDVDAMMMMDSNGSSSGNGNTTPGAIPGGIPGSSSFKQQVLKNSKGKMFWDTFSESGASSNGMRTPPNFGLPRGSSSAMSIDDMSIDSPSSKSESQPKQGPTPFALPPPGNPPTTSSSSSTTLASTSFPGATNGVPTAAEITRRINNKRRRDDDLDPMSFKRRAVSPGMGSPIMQSPMQRDHAPWGPSSSRPGSVNGDGVRQQQENHHNGNTVVGGATTPVHGRPSFSTGKRVGLQGMVDTNDGITRLSIE
ncbi:hypothetical protein SMACR_03463 [Sordaria macrospora]|uniref:WGS project CABT00000000 data, contig 2.10 n=2 Tax=Sordaria macrospora TaxID=5147 RepID=F7VW85_SORMK|nr:uncharacterized protein SMAC_03463 [Sordaria macrospora k-hell]KAA8633003.1 hypothetical protein SMACR_03463 [Sordaria macrospora]KAH7629881.1 hypothetical protein B0T09DRAFT_264511 [Sordaria sp. MPI-SDFR-AT-0083]WPJ66576.1 hypothetical protein SMAC4_03463 [Sordaria macrospora]CCC09907.1 unnamed protein product [Sordaria macrospora k-hell]